MMKVNSMSERDKVLEKVWHLFDVLRGDINTEDYFVILLFIYLRSENIISERLQHDRDSKNTLIWAINDIREPSCQEVFNILEPLIKALSNSTIIQVIDLLLSIDSTWLYENRADVFDATLERIALSQGKRGGEFIQPKQLTEVINSYIGSTDGLKIYNPFAGVTSFIKDYKQSSNVYAQELNKKRWAIGQLRLMVHQCQADYRCEDSLSNWQTNQKFDLIISNPPFGLPLNEYNKHQFPEFRKVEDFLIGMSVNSLAKDGRSITVLPMGILFRGGSEKQLRKRLIQEDLIDTIISFPGGVLYHTGIPFIVLILNKAKRHTGKIRLVNASSFVSRPTRREHIIEVENFLKATQVYEDSAHMRIVSNDKVIANEYNLNLPRYFQKTIHISENEQFFKLGNLLHYKRGSRKDLPETGKVIRIRDLMDDEIEYKLSIENTEEIPLGKLGVRKIEFSCLLLAVKLKTLKPTYFHFEKEPIYTGTDIIQFTVDENIVDIGYLINQLHSDYVQQQLEAFRQGTTVSFINRDDLLKVKIKLPSIELQRAKVSGLNEFSNKMKELQSERNAFVHGVGTNEFNEFASLKHTLGTPRQNILGWSKNLSKFFIREKDAISVLNNGFKELFDFGIIEAIEEINRDIKFISDVLEKGEKGLFLKDYDKNIVPLTEINSIVNNLSNNGFKFSIIKQLLKVEEMKTRGININKTLFKTLVDNILTNANKYGFKEKEDPNHVKIEINEMDNLLIIDIRNNGFPFPTNFDREKFITKFATADRVNGSGIGGHDIDRIANYFENSDWELILNNDPLYPVIFRFSLPIKLIN